MKYVVIEFQTYANGTMSTPTYAFDNMLSAEAKYHSILAAAAVSSLPVHSCVLMTNEGVFIKTECFKHEEEVNE